MIAGFFRTDTTIRLPRTQIRVTIMRKFARTDKITTVT